MSRAAVLSWAAVVAGSAAAWLALFALGGWPSCAAFVLGFAASVWTEQRGAARC